MAFFSEECCSNHFKKLLGPECEDDYSKRLVTSLVRRFEHNPLEIRSRYINLVRFISDLPNPLEFCQAQEPEFWATENVEKEFLFNQERQRILREEGLEDPKHNDDLNVLGESMMEGMETCSKCGSSDINKTLDQTRGGDEGMTVKYHCQDCNERWKV